MGGNVYTVISPWDVYYSGKETYFTPASWSFFIWPLIHMLILGTCIYQFSGRGKEVIIERIGWKLPLLDFLNAMYIYSWTIQEYRYENLANIQARSKRRSCATSATKFFLHLPFSLYHGWTVCLVFMSAFEAFGVNAVTEPADVWTKVALVDFSYAYSAIEGDLPSCLAITWYLFAVVVQADSRTALGFAIFSLCWVMRCLIGLELKYRGRRNRLGFGDETSRLLGGH
ncbi:hypothetical protein EDD16DRAFT_1559480 [Pisolithus croceorrhizus]|nr:hypothetical protein EDD16DRAFT_1559480 [Pisolithus croceorrhizus]